MLNDFVRSIARFDSPAEADDEVSPRRLVAFFAFALAVFGFTFGAALLGFLFGVTGGFAPSAARQDLAAAEIAVNTAQPGRPREAAFDRAPPRLSQALVPSQWEAAPVAMPTIEPLQGPVADEPNDALLNDELEDAPPLASYEAPLTENDFERAGCGTPPCP